MSFTVKTEGLEATIANLNGQAKQVRFAGALALTRTSKAIRDDVIAEMGRKFDRPTSYATRQAIQMKMATPDKMIQEVGLGVSFSAPSKGTPYEKALHHLFEGGTRSWKKMEGAFMRAGILPRGYMMVPGAGCPLDNYGNPPRSLIVQLISYFQAFAEQGYRANMTQRRKDKLALRGSSANGFKTINGVEYFVSHGQLQNPRNYTYGVVNGELGFYWKKQKISHLAPGIWSRSGIHGSNIKPIFMFVRAGQWKAYIDLHSIGQKQVQLYPQRFTEALNFALETAK